MRRLPRLFVALCAGALVSCTVASPEPTPEPRPEPPATRPETPPPAQPAATGGYAMATLEQCNQAAKNFWRLTTKQAMDGLGPDATIDVQATVHEQMQASGPQFITQWTEACTGKMMAPMVDCFSTMTSINDAGKCGQAR
jgi:hypothetical protein